MTERTILLYRIQPGDTITIPGGDHGNPPPRTVRVADLITEAAEANPSARLIPPAPEDGIDTLWEVRIDGLDNLMLFKLHTAGSERFLDAP